MNQQAEIGKMASENKRLHLRDGVRQIKEAWPISYICEWIP